MDTDDTDAMAGLSLHDLLVVLVRERENDLFTTNTDWYEGGLTAHKVLDADAVASLIEEVLTLAPS